MILNNFLFFFKNHVCDWVKKRIVEEEMSRWRERERRRRTGNSDADVYGCC